MKRKREPQRGKVSGGIATLVILLLIVAYTLLLFGDTIIRTECLFSGFYQIDREESSPVTAEEWSVDAELDFVTSQTLMTGSPHGLILRRCSKIILLDWENGDVLWETTHLNSLTNILYNSLDDTVYARGYDHVHAVDPANGRLKWSTEEAALLRSRTYLLFARGPEIYMHIGPRRGFYSIDSVSSKIDELSTLSPNTVLVDSQKMYTVDTSTTHTLQALDRNTGHLLWDVDLSSQCCYSILMLGRYIVLNGAPEGRQPVIIDTDNGQIIWKADQVRIIANVEFDDGYAYALDSTGRVSQINLSSGATNEIIQLPVDYPANGPSKHYYLAVHDSKLAVYYSEDQKIVVYNVAT